MQPGLRLGLESGGYVDALPEGIVLEKVDVPQVDPDPHEEGFSVGFVSLLCDIELVLDLQGGLQWPRRCS